MVAFALFDSGRYAETLESSDFTSVQRRVQAVEQAVAAGSTVLIVKALRSVADIGSAFQFDQSLLLDATELRTCPKRDFCSLAATLFII